MATTTTTPEFAADFQEALRRLRGALTGLLGTLNADPARPQELARRFGIDKTLAWKVSRLLADRDPFTAARHVPGASATSILLERVSAGPGAPTVEIERVRSARAAFEAMVALHAGDRATFELMLGGLAPETERASRLESGRKLSYQGNSATWGVQARVRLAAQIIAPNRERPDLIDMAVLSGFRGFRRLRRTAWPLVHVRSFGLSADADGPQALDPHASGAVPLLPGFCSDPLPSVRAVEEAGGSLFELESGPIGNTRAVDCSFGWMQRRFAAWRADAEDDVAEHSVILDTPVEELQFDIYRHRSLPFTDSPEVAILSDLEARAAVQSNARARRDLALPVDLQPLGEGPPEVATALVQNYGDMVELACNRLGHPLEEFAGYRLSLRFPPIPATALIYYPLPH